MSNRTLQDPNMTLTITSLLSILFRRFTGRMTSSAGSSREGSRPSVGVLILVVWLYGTLVLAERRSGTSSSFSGRSLVAASRSST